MSMALEVKNLSKIYKGSNNAAGKTALDDLNLNIKEGSIFGLLGPNGAGKSTLINIIAGTVIKSSGTVKVAGFDIDTNRKTASKHIGVVPQEIIVDSFFSLFQLLEFTAGYYGLKPEERKTEEVLTALGLIDKKNALPRQLSGGMKRRFLVAKAIVHFPKVLILDEPTAGVDIELREQLWEYVRTLHKRGTTIIITTHYLTEAEELCDEIAFINYGKIIKQDSKDNLFNTLGSKSVEVEFTSPIRNIKLPFEEGLKIVTDNKISIDLDASKNDNFNILLNKLQSTELCIKDLQIKQADLEDIFKKLIK